MRRSPVQLAHHYATPPVAPCPACTLPFGEVSDEWEFDIPPHTCGLPQVPNPLDRATSCCAGSPTPESLARCSWCGEEYDLEDRQSVYCSDLCAVFHRLDD